MHPRPRPSSLRSLRFSDVSAPQGGVVGDPAWQTAYPGVLYWLWTACGDTRVPAAYYADLKALLEYEAGRVAQSGIGKMFSSCAYGSFPRARVCMCACCCLRGVARPVSCCAGYLRVHAL